MTALFKIESLPHRKATDVKNGWGAVVRTARAHGGVAITHHGQTELVLVTAGQFRELAALAEQTTARAGAALAELSAEFDARLVTLQAPDAPARLEKVFAARGRAASRSKAGSSF